jgi:hypothetical protein
MRARDSKRINALYALWGLLAPLAVLAWFGARELWESRSSFQVATPTPHYTVATALGEPSARPSGTWEVHCYLSAAEPPGFLPVDAIARPALAAFPVVGDRVPRTTLLASAASAPNRLRLDPDPSPPEDTGHESPLFCP